MKNITILIILGLFLISMTTIQTLTSRSKQQVVFHSNDLNQLTRIINDYYKDGYRVTLSTSQSISTSLNSRINMIDFRDIKGEILVIMEK